MSIDNAPQLRDIHIADPGIWPPAPGWWIVTIIALAVGIYLFRRLLTAQRQKKHTQRLLSLLDSLESDSKLLSDTARLGKLSELLKQLALMRYGSQRVSSLSGTAWLKFLDNTGGDGGFIDGAGRVLSHGPYSKQLHKTPDWDALSQLIKRWIHSNTSTLRRPD